MAQAASSGDRDGRRSALREACARNKPVELHRRASGAIHPVMRARMIRLDDEHLYLDQPQIIGRQIRLNAGDEVEAYFEHDDRMYTFRTTVTSMRCDVRLNTNKIVPGLSLAAPSKVATGQRRSFYRTLLAADPTIPVLVHGTNPAQPDMCPLDAPRFSGLLVDASQGGFGVNIERLGHGMFEVFDHVFVRFVAPRGGPEVILLCEVRQRRLLHDGQVTRLGMLALPWPDVRHLNMTTQPLGRYLAELERRARHIKGAA